MRGRAAEKAVATAAAAATVHNYGVLWCGTLAVPGERRGGGQPGLSARPGPVRVRSGCTRCSLLAPLR